MGIGGMYSVGSRDEGVDVYLFQEVPVLEGDKTVVMDGYDSVDGVGGFLGRGEGAVVCTKVHERWEGKWRVIVRERVRIGLLFDVGGGRKLEVWNIYVGQGKHREFEWVEGDGNKVVMGDINARHERWGGGGVEGNVEGRRVVEWMDDWGWSLGTPRGVCTRRDERDERRDGVLDVGLYTGGVEVVGKVWDWVVGLDHRPLEMEVEVIGVVIIKEEDKKGIVDWKMFECGLRLREVDWRERGGNEVIKTREELECLVEEWEGLLVEEVEKSRGRRRWRRGKKKWWDGEVEREYNRVKEVEKEWMRGVRVEGLERVREARKEYKRKVEEIRRRSWGLYLESLGEKEGYQWVKMDRDFVVDVPGIRLEEGGIVEDDEGKGEAIVRGLGKREELDQEREGFWEAVEVSEEEVKECVWKQNDRKAAGENELGGRVLKEVWKVDWGRRVLMRIVRGSLSLGYVCKRWRKSVGIIMRKPNKLDYGLPNSYRVINLLDVVGKVIERLVAGRLERWGQEGMGDEQFGGRVGRSSLDGVGALYKRWEEGGEKGLLLCMDVMGGYENVGVRKCVERLEKVGVEEYLVKWASSFLREREVKVRVGKRIGGGVKMKGGTVQGSPLSPILFMFVLGGVLEEVRKEKVEGVEIIACVDDVDFMVVGKDEGEMRERMEEMGVALMRGLERWEVDVQKMKLEGMWMEKGRMEERGEVRWLGEVIKMKLSVRVLGVWLQCDGGWKEHVLNRMRVAENRWRLMLKLFGRGGRGMRVEDMKRIWKMVVGQSLMYGMELYWNEQEGMRNMLQVWMNRHIRRILGGVRSTPVDAMLGELGEKRVEYELDRRVERWGMRLLRKGKGRVFGKSWREKEVEGGVYVGGWVGRMMRGARKHKLEGEVWEVEKEREGCLRWEVIVSGNKEKARERWEWSRKERERDYVVGISDASGEGMSVGIGGGVWDNGMEVMEWREMGGCGMTVDMGEMYGLKRLMERVEGNYKGEKRRLLVGVDNVGVLKKLRKGRGFCGEVEQGVRRVGKRLMEKGWEIKLVWVAGHVGIEENEVVDERAKEGCWEEVGEEEDILGWSKWEQRRKEHERRRWKEWWVTKRKGEEYFGNGSGGELGHGGKRWESRFLLWMRTNHGRMEGMRYKREEKRCECGGREDRDHLLLYCSKWKEERKKVWRGWWGGWLEGEGWIDMERMLFSEEGVKRVLEFGKEIGWDKRKWGNWRKKDDGSGEGVGWRLRPRKEGGGGWLMERSEKRRREILEGSRLRTKRWREERSRREGSRERRMRMDETNRKKKMKRIEEKGKVVVGVRKDMRERLSVRDLAVGRSLGRSGRNVLGEVVNVGGRIGSEIISRGGELGISGTPPIASGVTEMETHEILERVGENESGRG